MGKVLSRVSDSLKKVVTVIVDGVKKVFKSIKEMFSVIINGIKNIFKLIVEKVKEFFIEVKEICLPYLKAFKQGKVTEKQAEGAAGEAIGQLGEGLVKRAGDAFEPLRLKVSQLMSGTEASASEKVKLKEEISKEFASYQETTDACYLLVKIKSKIFFKFFFNFSNFFS